MTSNLSTQLLLKGMQSVEIFTGADDQDPLTWLQNIDELFDAIKIDKNDRRRLLPMYFGEDIKKWYRSETHGTEYDVFKEQFIKTFTSSGYKLKIYSRIINRRQRADETVQSYHYDILSLCAKLNSDMPENEKILHLLRGLKASILQHVMMADPQTCKAFLEQAKRAEAAAAITQPQTETTTPTTELIEETTAALRQSTLNNNNQQYEKNNRPGQPSYNSKPKWSQQRYNNNRLHQQRQGGRSALTCYTCNGVGHYSYQCPSHLN